MNGLQTEIEDLPFVMRSSKSLGKEPVQASVRSDTLKIHSFQTLYHPADFRCNEVKVIFGYFR